VPPIQPIPLVSGVYVQPPAGGAAGSRLFLGGVFQPTLSPIAQPLAEWVVDDSVGADIALNADTTTIEILTTGIYAWTMLWGFDAFDPGNPASGTTGSGGWTPFMQQLTGTSIGSFSTTLVPLNQQAPCSVAAPLGAAMSCDFTFHMDAGDTFEFAVNLFGNSNVTNWRIEPDPNTLCYIIRLA
jgi:hypothetical protein